MHKAVSDTRNWAVIACNFVRLDPIGNFHYSLSFKALSRECSITWIFRIGLVIVDIGANNAKGKVPSLQQQLSPVASTSVQKRHSSPTVFHIKGKRPCQVYTTSLTSLFLYSFLLHGTFTMVLLFSHSLESPCCSHCTWIFLCSILSCPDVAGGKYDLLG